jgi:hypothetical protein
MRSQQQKLNDLIKLGNRMDLEIKSAKDGFNHLSILKPNHRPVSFTHEQAMRNIRCGIQYGYKILKKLDKFDMTPDEFNTYRDLMK